MKLSFYTGFMPMLREKGIEYTADFAARNGFSGVEFLEVPGQEYYAKSEKEALHIQNVLKENGLTVDCLSAALNLWEMEDGVEKLKEMMGMVAALGSPYLHHMLISWLKYPANAPTYEDAFPIILEKASAVAEVAKKYGLTCLYEGQGLYFNGVKGIEPFLSALKKEHDNVGLVGDVGNPLFVACRPEEFTARFAEDIKHVHLKNYIIKKFDTDPGRPWLLTESGKNGIFVLDQLPGVGDVDLDDCLASLKKVGYQGAFSLESELDDPMEESIRKAVQWAAVR